MCEYDPADNIVPSPLIETGHPKLVAGPLIFVPLILFASCNQDPLLFLKTLTCPALLFARFPPTAIILPLLFNDTLCPN